jgi:hypothetical protein
MFAGGIGPTPNVTPTGGLNVYASYYVSNYTWAIIFTIGQLNISGSLFFNLPPSAANFTKVTMTSSALFGTAVAPLCGVTAAPDPVCGQGRICEAISQIYQPSTGFCACTVGTCTGGLCIQVSNTPALCANALSVVVAGNLSCGTTNITLSNARAISLLFACPLPAGCTANVLSTAAAGSSTQLVSLTGQTNPVNITWYATIKNMTVTLTNIQMLTFAPAVTITGSTFITTDISNITFFGTTMMNSTISSQGVLILDTMVFQVRSILVQALSIIIKNIVITVPLYAISPAGYVSYILGQVTGGSTLYHRGTMFCSNSLGVSRLFRLVGWGNQPGIQYSSTHEGRILGSVPGRKFLGLAASNAVSTITVCGVAPTYTEIPSNGVLNLNLLCATGGGPPQPQSNGGSTLTLNVNATVVVNEFTLISSESPIPHFTICNWTNFVVDFNPQGTTPPLTTTSYIRLFQCDTVVNPSLPTITSLSCASYCTCFSAFSFSVLQVIASCGSNPSISSPTSTTTTTTTTSTTTSFSTYYTIPTTGTKNDGVPVGVGVGVGVGVPIVLVAIAGVIYAMKSKPTVDVNAVDDTMPSFAPKAEPYTPSPMPMPYITYSNAGAIPTPTQYLTAPPYASAAYPTPAPTPAFASNV